MVLTYILAPVPNWLCGRAATHDDFMDGAGAGVVDLGRFLTGFFVVMGIGMSVTIVQLFKQRANIQASTSCIVRTLQSHNACSYDYEYYWRLVDLCNHH